MFGPMRNPDIQNLLEAFASLNKAIKQGPHTLGNGSLEFLVDMIHYRKYAKTMIYNLYTKFSKLLQQTFCRVYAVPMAKKETN